MTESSVGDGESLGEVEVSPRTTVQIQALQPDQGQRGAPPRSKGAARSGSCRVTELGLTGDLSGHLDQRYVTEQRGLVGIAR